MGEETAVGPVLCRVGPVASRDISVIASSEVGTCHNLSYVKFMNFGVSPNQPHSYLTSEETEADLASQSVDMSFAGSLTDVRIIMAAPLHLAVLAGRARTLIPILTRITNSPYKGSGLVYIC